jgi:16S rRNA (guanine527-N7)-methyltransferase
VKHPPELGELRAAAESLGIWLSEDRARRLAAFERLLRDHAIPMGIVADSDARRLRERHVLDCLRAATAVETATSAYDLGSGAGLPGIVVAIAAPALRVGLVESRRRRVSFLELAIQELGVGNARVLPLRVEAVVEVVDLCFARAFAPLEVAWSQASRLLSPGGRLVYFAGGVPKPAEVPDGARLLEVRTTPVLESAGPLVIMTRQ